MTPADVLRNVPTEVLISAMGERAARRSGQPSGFSNPNWGNRVAVASTRRNSDGPIPILQFPEQAGREYIVPQVFTVAVSADIDRASWTGSSKDASMILDVTAGAGAAYQSFELDLNPGTQFTIVANTIEVKARWLDDDADHPNLSILGTVGHGANSGDAGDAPSCTRRIGSIDTGNSTVVQVPRFATSFVVLSGDANSYNTTNTFEVRRGPAASDPLAVSFGGAEAEASKSDGSLKLPAGSISLEFTNNSGATISGLDLKFLLSL